MGERRAAFPSRGGFNEKKRKKVEEEEEERSDEGSGRTGGRGER